jgi:hypothetical protein
MGQERRSKVLNSLPILVGWTTGTGSSAHVTARRPGLNWRSDGRRMAKSKRSAHDRPAPDSGGRPAKHQAGKFSRAIIRTRIGFRTTNARMAATILSADAAMNTAVQPSVAAVSTLPSGTRSAAVPLAV